MSASITETRVTFGTPEGRQLAGILTEPADVPYTTETEASDNNKPFSARHCGILCHGFASHKNGFHFPAIAAYLATNLGMSSLRFDYAGNMDSSGEFKFGGFMKEVEQMAAAKAFLEQQHHKQVVMLLGHSRGAINATLYTAKYGDIPIVMLIAGRYDLTLNMTQRYGPDVLQQLHRTGPWEQTTRRDGDKSEIHWKLTAEEMQERFPLDIPAACAAIGWHKSQPPNVLVIHGAADDICQQSDAQKLADSMEMQERFSLDIPAACAAIGQHKPQPPNVLVIHGATDDICQLSDAQKLADCIAEELISRIVLPLPIDLQEMQERFSLDIPAACAAIGQHKPQPPNVLVVHGAADDICQLSDAQKLADSISGATFVSIQGANHWFKGRQQQLLDAVDSFVRQTWQQRVS